MNLHAKLSAVYIALIVTLIAVVDAGRLQGVAVWVHRVPLGDKLGHFILMGLTAFIVWTEIRARSSNAVRPTLAVLGLTLLVGLEELSQISLPTRRFDPADFLADLAGIAFFTWIAYRSSKKSSVSRPFSESPT